MSNMSDNPNFSQSPVGGSGRLRALLDSLNEDQSKLNTHPIYKEGYDDGYRAAQENHKRLTRAIANVYRIDDVNEW
jgi:hypothetical protein